MKLQTKFKPATRSSIRAIRTRKSLLHACRAASRKNKPWLDSDLVHAFKRTVKKRPKDVSWLHHYGWLGRSMGVTYEDALAVVRPHFKKLRGNTRRSWIERGLREGYDLVGLRA